jgi:hypothetical protein
VQNPPTRLPPDCHTPPVHVRSRRQRLAVTRQDRVHAAGAVRPTAHDPCGDAEPEFRDRELPWHSHRDRDRQVLAGADSVAGHVAIFARRGDLPLTVGVNVSLGSGRRAAAYREDPASSATIGPIRKIRRITPI